MKQHKLIRSVSATGFALAFVIMISANVYMTVQLRAFIAGNQMVTDIHKVEDRIEELFSLIIDIENGPRGYVITGQEKFLQNYNSSLLHGGGIIRHVEELRQLTRNDPWQQRRIDTLEPFVAKKLSFMQRVVDLRRNAGFQAAQAFILTDVGRQTMKTIHQILVEMQNREELLLRQHTDEVALSFENILATMTFSTALSFFLLLMSFILLNREVTSRVQAEEALREANSELDNRVEKRTAELFNTAEKLMRELEKTRINEREIAFLNRVYATLGQVNQTIVRTKSKAELFQTISRVAVEYGKFGLAWIGELDRETGLVTPTVVYGAQESALPLTAINIRQEPFKNGIISSAVETGKVVSCKNIQTDPAMHQWLDLAIAGGFHSAASLPIWLNGAVVSLLNLYAAEVEFFSKEEMRLLEEMAMDLSFALEAIQLNANNQQVQESLRLSEKQFRSMFEDHSAIMILFDPDTGYIVEANHAAVKFYGWPIEKFRQTRIQQINTLSPEKVQLAIKQVISGENNHFIFRHRRADGSIRDVEIYSNTVETKGKLLINTVVYDITERLHYEITNAFNLSLILMEAAHSIEELLQTTVDEAERLTESSIGFFHIVAEDQTALSMQVWSTNTIKERCKTNDGLQHDPGLWLDAARERKAVIYNDYAAIKLRIGMPEGHAEVRCAVVVPILRNDKVVGILGVGNKPGNYDENDVKWLGILADIAWNIVAKKIAEDEQKLIQAQKYAMENLAMHDSLTGLPNRRLLSDRIGQVIAQSKRNKTMAALMVFDLDKFKFVNDTFGHGVGDSLLQEVAIRTLRTLQRSVDSIARIGGDEFVVLLPQIFTIANAVASAEKIVYAIKEPFEVEGHPINIACSIGIAIYPDHGQNELTWMKHADDAMYQSKGKGGNCVSVYGGEPS